MIEGLLKYEKRKAVYPSLSFCAEDVKYLGKRYYNLNEIFSLRVCDWDSANETFKNPRTQEFEDANQYWNNEDGIKLSSDIHLVSFYGRQGLMYPNMILKCKFPDFSGQGYARDIDFYIGLENGCAGYAGAALMNFHFSASLETSGLAVYILSHGKSSGTLSMPLPSDFATAYHYYSIQVMRGQVWFFIDGKLTNVIIPFTGKLSNRMIYSTGDSYRILIAELPPITVSMRPLVEVMGRGQNITWEGIKTKNEDEIFGFRWWSGDPQPPLNMPITKSSGTSWQGQSISANETSHPIPFAGYSLAEIYFKANAGGNLKIEGWFDNGTQSGSWEEVDSVSVSADTLKRIEVDHPMPVFRVKYDTAATISIAQVSMM